MPVHYSLTLALFFFINLAGGRVILSLYALHLGASPFAVGVVMGTFYLFPLFLSWPVGLLSDRWGVRWLLVFAAVASGLSMFIPYVWSSMAVLYAASALAGLSLAFYNVSLQSLIGIVSAPEERTKNFANLSLVGSTSNAIGPIVAGWSMDHAGPQVASLIMVSPSLGALVMLLGWGARLPGGRPASGPKTKLFEALADRSLWRMLTVSALVQLAMDLFQFFIPVYGHSKSISDSAIGLTIGAFATSMFFVRFALPQLVARFGELRLLEYSFYIAVAGYLAVPLCDTAGGLVLVGFLMGLGIGASAPLTMILMFSRSAEGRSGESMALRLTANNLVRASGPTLFGLIASGAGLVAVFVLSALLMCWGGVLSRPARAQNSRPISRSSE